MSLARRLELCAEAGIELAIVEPFTREFAAIARRRLRTRRAGARSRARATSSSATTSASGAGGPATPSTLAQLGASLGIDVAVIQPVAIAGTPCSSTRIRELVAAGDTVGAAPLLGRPFELEGRVVRGAGRGRGLGFPTANVAAEGELRPALGIYAGRARVLDGPLAGESHRGRARASGRRTPTFCSSRLRPAIRRRQRRSVPAGFRR